MKKKAMFNRFSRKMAMIILTGALLLSGCASGKSSSGEGNASASGTQTQVQYSSYVSSAGSSEVTTLDVSDLFSKRDLTGEYEEKECVRITLNGKEASCDSTSVSIEDGVIIIKEDGSYILQGSYEGSIRVEAPEDAKVQLILDGVTLTQNGTAAIYAKTADKVFITLAEDSNNEITCKGDFENIDENNVDGAIFSKCDLTLNGSGTLTVSSEKGHGIVSKDDLKITGGTYVIDAGNHGISGKDSIRVADGNVSITVTSTEDGFHSGNDEDADKGYVYIAGGNITISAGDDGIHGESKVVIAGGTVNIEKSYEGIEAKVVEIAGGTVTVVASDDGLNVTDGSGSESFGGDFGPMGAGGKTNSQSGSSDIYILISGGTVSVDAKGDGIDSNGSLFVTGGEVYVNGPENNGNGALDYNSKAEITGGSLIAIGSSGMSMNFSNATQGCALITTQSTHKAGEVVQLKDADGNVLLSLTAARSFASVVVSSPLMKQGETYTLIIGSETQTITLDQLIYGQSNGFGGPGGFGGSGGFDGGQMPGGQGGRGQRPDGQDGESGGRTGGKDKPGSGDGNFGEGFDGSFEGMPQMPGGFNGVPGGNPQGLGDNGGT